MPSNKPSIEPQTQPPLRACCTRAPGPCRRPGLREQAHLPLPCDVRGWVRDHQQASHALERHCTSGARVELGTFARLLICTYDAPPVWALSTCRRANRLLICTYDAFPWGVRVDELTASKEATPAPGSSSRSFHWPPCPRMPAPRMPDVCSDHFPVRRNVLARSWRCSIDCV